MVSNSVNVSGNTAIGDGTGFNLVGYGDNVTGNYLNNTVNGIDLGGMGNIVSGNTASGSTIGIWLQASTGNNVTWNTLLNSSSCNIELTSSTNNLIYGNSFINSAGGVNSTGGVNALADNTQNQWNSTIPINYTYDGQNFTSLYGNYWSDYTGYDNNNDGIGDIPYVSGNVTDYYPIVLVSLHRNVTMIGMEYTSVEQPGNMNCEVWVVRSGLMNTTCSLNYSTVDGTAIAGANYTATSGTLTFQPNETSQVIWVNLVDVPYNTPGKTFQVVLSNPVNASIGQGTTDCVIDENDPWGV
jgi:parallel beta-helix repeat protein